MDLLRAMFGDEKVEKTYVILNFLLLEKYRDWQSDIYMHVRMNLLILYLMYSI